LPLVDLPPEEAKRLPRYPTLPAVRIGRLAVDQHFQKRGLGAALLADGAFRTLQAPPARFLRFWWMPRTTGRWLSTSASDSVFLPASPERCFFPWRPRKSFFSKEPLIESVPCPTGGPHKHGVFGQRSAAGLPSIPVLDSSWQSDKLKSMASKTATTTAERIGRLGQRRQVVIPREIVESLRMRTGDFLAITQKANAVIIKAKRMVDADDVLTTKEAKLVRRGEAQLKRGESKPWRDVKNALER
jgi:bifunctional DNA-binding transcriptional regulator/antitoxin component of YhaV-PrlF toxin-antitoxin module